jgi:prophage tail gpP-like protein
MPNPAEVAVLIVRGTQFKDWLSVWVQHRWADAWPQFRFTAAERKPYPNLWEKVQFVPGDKVVITLGGVHALSGYIITRQVAYDAKNHQVMLHGMGRTFYAATSSVIDETMNFDGMTFEQVARRVWAPWPVSPEVIGTLDATPFVKLRANPGETTWNFIERIARVRGVVLGSQYYGVFLLIGDHIGVVTDTLIEGHNILKCQCVITKKDIFSKYIQIGQTPPDDKKWGEEANQMRCAANSVVPPPEFKALLTPAEQPVRNQGELCTRAEYEAQWHDGSVITATVTVQGWLRPGKNDIWRVGDDVAIYSPMALLHTGDGRAVTLKIQTATFTQDDKSGTLTTLDLVLPWLLNDKIAVNISMPPGVSQAPVVGPDAGAQIQTPPPHDPADIPGPIPAPGGIPE